MKATRAIAGLASFALLGLGLAGCAASAPSTASTASAATVHSYPTSTAMGKIQQRSKLIVGVKYDFPLFGLKNPVTGKMEGIDIQIAQALAKDLTGSANKIQYVEVSSANREVFLQQNKVDVVIATYPPSPARSAAVDFAGPYIASPVTSMVQKSNTTINGPQDLAGKNVCVTTGSNASTLIPINAPKAKVTTFGLISQCAQALEQGRVDAVTTTDSALVGLVAKSPTKFKIAEGALVGADGKPAVDNFSIGLPKGEKAFHDYLDSFLEQIDSNGEYRKMYDSTLGTVKHDQAAPPKILF